MPKLPANTPNPSPSPPRNWSLILGSVLMENAAAIWIQKYGAQTPDWAIVLLFFIGAIPLLIASLRYERFIKAGGKAKQQIKDHPLSFALLCLLLLIIFCNPAIVIISRLRPSTTSQSSMQLEKMEFIRGESTLAPDANLALNIWYVQRGPEPIKNFTALFMQEVLLQYPAGPDENSDQTMWNAAQKSIAPHRKEWLAGHHMGSNIDVGGEYFNTLEMHIANQHTVDRILDGTMRMYFIVWTGWTGSDGKLVEQEDCQWLQRPPSPDLSNPMNNIWHACEVDRSKV